MVNVRSVNSMVVLDNVENAQWLIYRGTSGPGASSISCPVGQDFLGKYVHLDTFSWQTDFPPTPDKKFMT